VTLLGPGGVGKTRLARHFAATVAWGEAPPEGGVWFCDLTPARDPRGVVEGLRAGLDAPDTRFRTLEDGLDELAALLGERATLIVLDNVEQVAAPAARALARLLARCPDARFLVTSRAALGVERERILEVGPLPVPDAVEMLRDRAEGVRAGLGDIADDAATAIVERLEGQPLAIAMAAPMLVLLTPEGLLERLGARVGWLGGTTPDAPERHGTMARNVAWSWDQLDPVEARAAAQCALFRGGMTLRAAEAVLDLGGASVDEVVLWLRNASLLQAVPGKGEPRFALLEPVREHAVARLEASGEADATRQRFIAWVLEVAEAGPYGLKGHLHAQAERENLWAAWDLATAPQDVIRLANALFHVARTSPGSALGPVFERGIATAREEAPEEEAWLRYLRVLFRLQVEGDVQGALRDVEAVERLATTPRQRGWAHLGRAYVEPEDVPGRIAHFRAALDCFAAAGDRRYRTVALIGLAGDLWEAGQAAEAERSVTEALGIATAADLLGLRFNAMIRLAMMTIAWGRYEEADRLLTVYTDLAIDAGHALNYAVALRRRGDLAYFRGDLEGAEDLARQAAERAWYAERSGPYGLLGRVLRDRGAYDEALHWLDRARHHTADPAARATITLDRALTCAWADDPEAAVAEARVALEALRGHPLGHDSGAAAMTGVLEALAGRLERARELLATVPDDENADETRGMVALGRAATAVAEGRPAEARAELDALEQTHIWPTVRSTCRLIRRHLERQCSGRGQESRSTGP
jgi:predicted ATPase